MAKVCERCQGSGVAELCIHENETGMLCKRSSHAADEMFQLPCSCPLGDIVEQHIERLEAPGDRANPVWGILFALAVILFGWWALTDWEGLVQDLVQLYFDLWILAIILIPVFMIWVVGKLSDKDK